MLPIVFGVGVSELPTACGRERRAWKTGRAERAGALGAPIHKSSFVLLQKCMVTSEKYKSLGLSHF